MKISIKPVYIFVMMFLFLMLSIFLIVPMNSIPTKNKTRKIPMGEEIIVEGVTFNFYFPLRNTQINLNSNPKLTIFVLENELIHRYAILRLNNVGYEKFDETKIFSQNQYIYILKQRENPKKYPSHEIGFYFPTGPKTGYSNPTLTASFTLFFECETGKSCYKEFSINNSVQFSSQGTQELESISPSIINQFSYINIFPHKVDILYTNLGLKKNLYRNDEITFGLIINSHDCFTNDYSIDFNIDGVSEKKIEIQNGCNDQIRFFSFTERNINYQNDPVYYKFHFKIEELVSGKSRSIDFIAKYNLDFSLDDILKITYILILSPFLVFFFYYISIIMLGSPISNEIIKEIQEKYKKWINKLEIFHTSILERNIKFFLDEKTLPGAMLLIDELLQFINSQKDFYNFKKMENRILINKLAIILDNIEDTELFHNLVHIIEFKRQNTPSENIKVFIGDVEFSNTYYSWNYQEKFEFYTNIRRLRINVIKKSIKKELEESKKQISEKLIEDHCYKLKMTIEDYLRYFNRETEDIITLDKINSQLVYYKNYENKITNLKHQLIQGLGKTWKEYKTEIENLLKSIRVDKMMIKKLWKYPKPDFTSISDSETYKRIFNILNKAEHYMENELRFLINTNFEQS